eukprot:gene6086-7768_t
MRSQSLNGALYPPVEVLQESVLAPPAASVKKSRDSKIPMLPRPPKADSVTEESIAVPEIYSARPPPVSKMNNPKKKFGRTLRPKESKQVNGSAGVAETEEDGNTDEAASSPISSDRVGKPLIRKLSRKKTNSKLVAKPPAGLKPSGGRKNILDTDFNKENPSATGDKSGHPPRPPVKSKSFVSKVGESSVTDTPSGSPKVRSNDVNPPPPGKEKHTLAVNKAERRSSFKGIAIRNGGQDASASPRGKPSDIIPPRKASGRGEGKESNNHPSGAGKPPLARPAPPGETAGSKVVGRPTRKAVLGSGDTAAVVQPGAVLVADSAPLAPVTEVVSIEDPVLDAFLARQTQTQALVPIFADSSAGESGNDSVILPLQNRDLEAGETLEGGRHDGGDPQGPGTREESGGTRDTPPLPRERSLPSVAQYFQANPDQSHAAVLVDQEAYVGSRSAGEGEREIANSVLLPTVIDAGSDVLPTVEKCENEVEESTVLLAGSEAGAVVTPDSDSVDAGGPSVENSPPLGGPEAKVEVEAVDEPVGAAGEGKDWEEEEEAGYANENDFEADEEEEEEGGIGGKDDVEPVVERPPLVAGTSDGEVVTTSASLAPLTESTTLPHHDDLDGSLNSLEL